MSGGLLLSSAIPPILGDLQTEATPNRGKLVSVEMAPRSCKPRLALLLSAFLSDIVKGNRKEVLESAAIRSSGLSARSFNSSVYEEAGHR